MVVFGWGKAPTPTLSAFLRKQPVLLRADFVLTDPDNPYPLIEGVEVHTLN